MKDLFDSILSFVFIFMFLLVGIIGFGIFSILIIACTIVVTPFAFIMYIFNCIFKRNKNEDFEL